ncbi:MAG: MFS transporter [Promethearchaeia archaeon]
MIKGDQDLKKTLTELNINQKKAIFTVMLSSFVDVLGYTLIFPLLPTIQGLFGAKYIIMGLIIAANPLAALFFSPIWGRLSDKYGRKPILLISQSGTLIAFLILATSPTIEIILFSRILDGIFGGQIPVLRAFITDATDESDRGIYMAKFMNAFLWGMIVGPAIGGFLGAIDWRLVAYFGAILSGISIILTITILVETMPKERIKWMQQQITLTKDKKKEKMLTKAFLILMITFLLITFAHNIYANAVTFILNDRVGATPMTIGILMVVSGILFFIFTMKLYEPLYKKFGEKKLTLSAFLVIIVSFLIFPFLDQLWMFFVFLIPFSYSIAILIPAVQMKITFAAPQTRQGETSGWITVGQSIADITAPLLATYYLGLGALLIFDSYMLIGFSTSLLFLIAFIIMVAAGKKGGTDTMTQMMQGGQSEEEMINMMEMMQNGQTNDQMKEVIKNIEKSDKSDK